MTLKSSWFLSCGPQGSCGLTSLCSLSRFMAGRLVGLTLVILVIWALVSGTSYAHLVWEWLTWGHLLDCLMLHDRDRSVSSVLECGGPDRSQRAQLTWKPAGSEGQGGRVSDGQRFSIMSGLRAGVLK